MNRTIPNKESVRRVCLLSGASECYISVSTEDEYIDVLANVERKEMKHCLQELENWCGMKFRLHTLYEDTPASFQIKSQGEKILPID